MSEIKNRLLSRLADEDLARIQPHLEHVSLATKQNLVEPFKIIDYVYFPENCVISLLAQTEQVQAIEVGMIGFEGCSNFVINEDDLTPLRAVVQVPGDAWRIAGRIFATELALGASLNSIVLRFKEALLTQFAYTALSHGSFTIEERLARWLLMSHDRSQRNQMPLVHEFIAAMLAVRRSGVTTALHVLEGVGAIKALRATIIIRDRDKLIEIAGGSYGVPEAEYERLLG